MADDAPDFTRLPDLASRSLAGSVVHANDELFAERENLVKPGPAVFDPTEFGPKGKVYDGWETRRRREPGEDWAIVRLGVPGVVAGVVVDTSWFTGNFPPYASVEATSLLGHPSPAELESATWTTLVVKSRLRGDAENHFEVASGVRWTHVRLTIHPDGGVARFRVHGTPVPDPRLMTGTVDLAALELGGDVVDCSNMFYSSPRQLLLPDRAREMGEGWENARRRDGGNDHVTVALAAPGLVRRIEVDTSYFVGNAPGECAVAGLLRDESWAPLVPRVRLQPDTRHFFRVAAPAPVSGVMLNVYPDGGVARLRVHGEVAPVALAGMVSRWLSLMPEASTREVLAEAEVPVEDVERVLAGEPPSPAILAAVLWDAESPGR
ncbi:allantoicase [Nocardioides sp. MAHUQ-72]|uniref:allantoicase n=1 Tax=unclassified Nocardioides TaxID=2615069 RepID=UPI003622DBC9